MRNVERELARKVGGMAARIAELERERDLLYRERETLIILTSGVPGEDIPHKVGNLKEKLQRVGHAVYMEDWRAVEREFGMHDEETSIYDKWARQK